MMTAFSKYLVLYASIIYLVSATSEPLPTVYEYYTEGGINAGLSADQPYFTLNGRNITIYSGAMHYFRVPETQWRDRLRKMRAAGLNTVETYIPWNLHEFQDGVYDFGHGNSDFEPLLNVERFVKIAQDEDLLVIARPGPYICSEWEFGGLPSWLLKNEGIKVRTSDEVFMTYVARYFKELLSILTLLQFTRGGPIIAFQIENEYGSVGRNDSAYLEGLKQIYLDNNVKELLFTSDGASIGNLGQIPGVLYTANFAGDATNQLDIMQTYQPGKPSMVMEYWSGWFDHWTEEHHTTGTLEFTLTLADILHYPASVNFYMFHGGTNFGFMNGANLANGQSDNSGYQPTTNSYDYDAPLSEDGGYTEKYWIIREVLDRWGMNPVRLPDVPPYYNPISYDPVKITQQMTFEDLLGQDTWDHIETEELTPMELIQLPSTNNTCGQSYGYIVYRKHNLEISPNSEIKVLGHVTDTLMVLVNGRLQTPLLNSPDDLEKFGYYKSKDQTLVLRDYCSNCTLDLVVENWGRVNFGGLHQFEQFKGLHQGQLLFNNEELHDFEVIPLEFKVWQNKYLENWQPFDGGKTVGPKMYRAVLNLAEEPSMDTFIDTRNWNKGIIIVNRFTLSRYSKLGPQQVAYLPASLLFKGDNEIIFFEHFEGYEQVEFVDQQIFETVKSSKVFDAKQFVDNIFNENVNNLRFRNRM